MNLYEVFTNRERIIKSVVEEYSNLDYDSLLILLIILMASNKKYKIIDNFLNFWFRFIYHYRTAIELENFNFIKTMIKQDYTNYAGRILEHFFKQLLAETNQFNQIGSYWEKHNNNEIDIVAINDLEKTILIAETKLNKSKISLHKLAIKAQNLLLDYPGYKAKFLALSIEDVGNYLQL